ncbi:hypothetical protein O0L34_g6707 [Tuta absoluta]|nr:hypothetical protein O0L34_g6707 [Tuta absoluta]
MWCPPTPPAADTDVYCERWSRALYRAGAAPDAALPAASRRDPRARTPRRRAAPRPALAPPSLFERAGPRPRPRPRAPPAAPRDAPPAPDWAAAEDAALRRALRLQRLPADPPAALAPNWEWVSELVNESARAFRSARQARDRHDALADPERARRKHKKPAGVRRRADDDAPRPPLARLDAMRDAAERRRHQPKRRLDDAPAHNPKHAALLADHGVDYDTPPTPMEVATRRAERIAKEKLKAGASAGAGGGGGGTTSAAAGQPPAAPPAAAPPQRIVVAAHPGVSGAVQAAGAAQAGADPARRPAAALYRQQALPARHHLKILHHAPHAQGGLAGSVDASGAAPSPGTAPAALRTLQLQQLALRRAAPPASAAARAPHPLPLPHSHVVVAHLAPAPTPAPAPAPRTDPHHAEDRAQ